MSDANAILLFRSIAFLFLACIFLFIAVSGIKTGNVLKFNRGAEVSYVNRDENPSAFWLGVVLYIILGVALIVVTIFSWISGH